MLTDTTLDFINVLVNAKITWSKIMNYVKVLFIVHVK